MVISFYEPILIDVPGTHRQYVKFIVENFVVLGYNLYKHTSKELNAYKCMYVF